MSVRVMAMVWDLKLSASEKLVALKLADCASDDGGNAWPAVARISHETCLSERTVQTALKNLAQKQIVGVQSEYDPKGRPTTYRLNLRKIEALAKPYRARGATVAPPPPQPLHPSGATVAPPPVQILQGPGATVAPEPSREPSLEPSFILESGDGSDPAKQAFTLWNGLAATHGLAKVAKQTDGRRTKLKARLADCGGLSGWAIAMEKIAAAPWMLGNSDRGWRVTLDWILEEANFTKLMEGAYQQFAGRGGRGRDEFNEGLADFAATGGAS